MEFKTYRRLLTKDEKLRRAIYFYTYNMPNFEVEYVNGYYEEDEYKKPLVDIEKNLHKLDEAIKSLIYEYAEKEIYEETINLKCLDCDYEELNVDWERVDELWNGKDYPKLYCPECGKLKFVPTDIWNKIKQK